MVVSMKQASLLGIAAAALLVLGLCSTPAAGRDGVIVGPPIIGPPGPGWVWVPPVYETVYDRVWVEAQVERLADQVWVPAVYGYRPVYDSWGHVINYEYVVICGGYYETRWRDVVVPAHWQTVTRQVLVREGHWERIGPIPPPEPVIRVPVGVPTVGVDGYKTPTGNEGKGPFTPLWEWPK